MSSLNQVVLVGNMGSDLKVFTFNSGDRKGSVSVATTETWKDKTGAKREETQWHNVVIFNDVAINFLSNYASKGSKIAVTGKLKYRKFKDKDGVEKNVSEVEVGKFSGEVKILSRPSGQTQNNNDQPSAPAIDDEIPF